jgi:GNAT superfamily N-acetyltransferase
MPDHVPVVTRCVELPLPPHVIAEMEVILLQASARPPAEGAERDAFRERWLGRYLAGGSDVVLLARSSGGTLAGYLVGALEDPCVQPRFSDLAYLTGAFRDLCRRYPAHLHVNLAPAFRGKGIGGALIAMFAEHARQVGVTGVHVVTQAQARNLRFYQRCGFAEAGRSTWDGRDIVLLARML